MSVRTYVVGLVGAMLVFARVAASKAEHMIITEDTTINSVYDRITVREGSDPPTKVAIEAGGSIATSLTAQDSSEIRMYDGFVNNMNLEESSTAWIFGGDIEYNINIGDSATAYVSGGSSNRIYCVKSGSLRFFGDAVTTGVSLDHSASADISGGTITGTLGAGSSNMLTISGGSIRKLSTGGRVDVSGGTIWYELEAYYESVVNLSGGQIERVESHHDSVVNLSGGVIEKLEAWDSGTIHVFGENLSYNDSQRRLSGLLCDGTAIDVEAWEFDSGRIVLHNAGVVPEPSTYAALISIGLAGLVLYWRRRRKP